MVVDFAFLADAIAVVALTFVAAVVVVVVGAATVPMTVASVDCR